MTIVLLIHFVDKELHMICIWYPFECDMGLDGTLTSHIERVECIFSHEITINLSFTTKKHIIKISQPPLQTTECDMASDQNCA